jgi:hypothetical protein
MSAEAIGQLVGLVESRGFVVPWRDIESDLGTQLPEDYKGIVEHFGPGTFEPFLNLLVPGIESPLLELRYLLRSLQRPLATLAPDNPLAPYELYPAPGGIIPWATAGTGEIYYWKTRATGPDDWTVLIQENRGPISYEFPGGVGDFLDKLLRSELSIPFVPNLNECDYDDEDEEPTVEELLFVADDGSWSGPGKLEAVSYFAQKA